MHQPPSRAAIDPQYRWDRTRIFPDEQRWEDEYAQLAAALPSLAALSGSLVAAAALLLHALQQRDVIAARIDRLLLYAALHLDEDTTQADAQARLARATQLQADFATSTAFFRPALLALPTATLVRFLSEQPALAAYQHLFDELARQRTHIQSPEVERVLAQVAPLAELPLSIFGVVKDADFTPPSLTREQDEPLVLTHGRYWAVLRGADRPPRRAAYQAYSAAFQARQHTLAAALGGAAARDVFLARARGYRSALHAALDADAIPIEVYHTLITTVRAHAPLFQRYLRLRRRAAGEDALALFDLWGALAASVPPLAYEQARETLLAALQPLGAAYTATLRHGLYQGRWVDVYETPNKRSGASSSGAYGVAPYLLLNWQNQLSDLYTLAHESGHAMHTYLAHTAQPYTSSSYPIVVAEVAAICNEELLTAHLLATAHDPDTRRAVLTQQLQRVVELLFWQALFAEFDLALHAQVEAREALTATWLSATLGELLRAYFGTAVAFDDRAGLLWAQFPHFYLNFYVWKFAAGIVAARALAYQLLHEGQEALERYLAFLRSGGARPPMTLLRDAGVDLTTSTPIEQAMQLFAEQIDQFEILLGPVSDDQM